MASTSKKWKEIIARKDSPRGLPPSKHRAALNLLAIIEKLERASPGADEIDLSTNTIYTTKKISDFDRMPDRSVESFGASLAYPDPFDPPNRDYEYDERREASDEEDVYKDDTEGSEDVDATSDEDEQPQLRKRLNRKRKGRVPEKRPERQRRRNRDRDHDSLSRSDRSPQKHRSRTVTARQPRLDFPRVRPAVRFKPKLQDEVPPTSRGLTAKKDEQDKKTEKGKRRIEVSQEKKKVKGQKAAAKQLKTNKAGAKKASHACDTKDDSGRVVEIDPARAGSHRVRGLNGRKTAAPKSDGGRQKTTAKQEKIRGQPSGPKLKGKSPHTWLRDRPKEVWQPLLAATSDSD